MEKSKKKIFLGLGIGLGFTGVIFSLAVSVLIHDSMGLSQTVSQDEMREIVASRPVLFDFLGKPMKVKDQDYQKVLLQGGYRVQQGSMVAMVSPQNQVALMDMSRAPLALTQGWSVESFEHELDRIIDAKRQAHMWLGNEQDLWFHNVLCWFSAILFVGMILIAHEERQTI